MNRIRSHVAYPLSVQRRSIARDGADAVIARLYRVEPVSVIASELGWTKGQVSGRARKLGLQTTKRRPA